MAMHQKEQLHDNSMSMMQSQHFFMGRSVGFNLGATYSSHRPQQQQQHAPSVSSSGVSFTPGNNQDLLHVHGSDMFPSSHSSYHSQMSQLRVIQNSMCHNVILPNNHQHYTKLGKRSSRSSLARLNNGDDFFVEALCQDGRIYFTIALRRFGDDFSVFFTCFEC
ncbi:probable NOT transcription complex subunit VIP2 [Morus notabilis]|uniref:probable NOT transcription complex subunit VIP2 n=1 Tax=Morus notabilis TaxID=981085 RepID=UPI000CED4DFC|nr:probable NOT transcription complex subunit VIP2 [Morus notabilis]